MSFRRFFSASFAQGLGLGLGFVTHLSLAYLLDIETYGFYNFIFSIASTISLFAVFGMQSSAQRLIPQFALDASEHNKTKHFIRFSSILTFIVALVSSGVIFGLLALYYETGTEPASLVYGTGFIMAVVLSLMRLQVGFFKGFHKGSLGLSYETTFREVGFLLVLWGGVLAGYHFIQAYEILLIYNIVLLFIFSFAAFHLKKFIPPSWSFIKADRAEIRRWLLISAPMMLIIATQMMLHRADIIILGFMVPMEDLGAYSFGAKLSQAASIAVVGAAAIFSPRAAASYKQGDMAALRHHFASAHKFMIIGTSAVCLLMVIGIHAVMYVFPNYEDGLWPFYILTFGYFLNAFWGPSTYIMIMTDMERRLMWMTFAAVALNIALTILFVTWWGPIGAAFATALSLNLRNAYTYLIYLKEFKYV